MRGKANGTPAEGSDTFLMFPPVELRQMSAFMAFSSGLDLMTNGKNLLIMIIVTGQCNILNKTSNRKQLLLPNHF
jgi:hypothetical protein